MSNISRKKLKLRIALTIFGALAAASGPSATAQTATFIARCVEAVKGATIGETTGRHYITVAEAVLFIGEGTPGRQIARGLERLRAIHHVNASHLATNVDRVLRAVALVTNHLDDDPGNDTWGYTSFDGTDGAQGFVGNNGHVIVISPRGQVYRGKLDDETSFRLHFGHKWPADYAGLTLFMDFPG